MKQSDIAARLVMIEEALARIELALSLRVPSADIRQAIEDVLDTRFEMGELREVYTNQRDALAAHFVLIDGVLSAGRALDEDIKDLLVQLRELGRKHVRGLSDLERAADWHEKEAERRDTTSWSAGDAERRKASTL